MRRRTTRVHAPDLPPTREVIEAAASAPSTSAVWQRMRLAHARAAAVFDAHVESDAREAWGWRGRSLGRPVTTHDGPAWLRIAADQTDEIVDTFWTGNVEAERHLANTVPRPRLRAWHDWTDQYWSYRAELYDHAVSQPIADSARLTHAPSLPRSWWATLRTTLDTIARTPTRRLTLQPGFLAWAMPHYLDRSADAGLSMPWTTAHGDLHFGNLCGPDLEILDWEGWGQAPAGYDAATLHCRSLTVPTAAARIRTELSATLNNPTGRHAELVVITQLLHAATTDGAYPELLLHLHNRATELAR